MSAAAMLDHGPCGSLAVLSRTVAAMEPGKRADAASLCLQVFDHLLDETNDAAMDIGGMALLEKLFFGRTMTDAEVLEMASGLRPLYRMLDAGAPPDGSTKEIEER